VFVAHDFYWPRPDLPAGPARVAGSAYHDANGNGHRDVGEAGLRGVRVFVDLNGNGRWNVTEPLRRTAADGSFAFDDLPAGPHRVREFVPAGWRLTSPGPAGFNTATGGSSGDLHFGHARPAPAPPVVGPLTPPAVARIDTGPILHPAPTAAWPVLQFGPDGRLVPLALGAPAAPSPTGEALDWCRVT
jgi:hypothetical protein